jgi:hypothetical protein
MYGKKNQQQQKVVIYFLSLLWKQIYFEKICTINESLKMVYSHVCVVNSVFLSTYQGVFVELLQNIKDRKEQRLISEIQ